MCTCEVPQGKLTAEERNVYVLGGMTALRKLRGESDTTRAFNREGAYGGSAELKETN